MEPLHAKYCLIGHPLGHSLSPFIHARLFAMQQREEEYALVDLAPEELTDAFSGRLRTISGCNVTIPYKQSVLPFCGRLEGKAALYKTVNCMAFTPDGSVGYNTDADGFLCALKAAALPLAGRVLLLGCGGVGTMFACEAAMAGCDVWLYDAISYEKATALASRVRELAPTVSCTALETLPEDMAFDLLINASPVGMYPHVDACPVSEALIGRCQAVFDAVYNPRETVLVRTAKERGIPAGGGMAMLVWQAVVAHQYWYGAQFENEAIDRLIDDCYTELDKQF